LTVSLAEALQVVHPSSSADGPARVAAWSVIEAALHQHWFTSLPTKLGASEDLVPDIRQTVLVRLVSGSAAFAGSTEGEAVQFLKATARNATIDTLRRRKRERPLEDDHLDRIGGGDLPDDRVRTEDVLRRFEQVVERATSLAVSPSRDMLERHLRETLLGQAPADASLDASPAAAAKLRKQRSRSLALLRRGHESLLAELEDPLSDPDEVDLIVRAVLASPRRGNPEDAR
jgi:DNA-directed RNA polymerase specialized sigma24 family protein